MKLLIDTSAYSELMRGHPGVAEHVRRAERIYLSAIVAGELLYGFRVGSRFQKNLDELRTFLENPYVDFVPVTMVTADRFSRIASALRRRGTPIPTNDVWIAAHALETGADLLSFDLHFQDIEGVAWVEPVD
jgi:predicted nucleic acid-binding protein